MIEFKALMLAIHKGVQDATQALEQMELSSNLDEYFEVIDENNQVVEGAKPSQYNWDKANHVCKPKMVPMEFPTRTPDGIEKVIANVPMITLAPINTSRIQEVTVTTHLDVLSNSDDTLSVAFKSNKKRAGLFGGTDEDSANTSIEIKLTGRETPEGLKQIIEGYERALRAQLPG